MLEVIFEDDHDTAAFLHLIQQSDDRRHFIVREGIKKSESQGLKRLFAFSALLSRYLSGFFGMQRRRAYAFAY